MKWSIIWQWNIFYHSLVSCTSQEHLIWQIVLLAIVPILAPRYQTSYSFGFVFSFNKGKFQSRISRHLRQKYLPRGMVLISSQRPKDSLFLKLSTAWNCFEHSHHDSEIRHQIVAVLLNIVNRLWTWGTMYLSNPPEIMCFNYCKNLIWSQFQW